MGWDGQDEFEMNMRLLGAPSLKDVGPHLVDTSSVHLHTALVPDDRLYSFNCMFFFRARHLLH